MSAASEEMPEKGKNAFDIIKTWLVNSPTHSIRRISRAKSGCECVFWSTTFLLCTALMCFFIFTVIMKHIAAPTKINLSVKQYRDPINFPAITFCNLNPLRDEKFLDGDKNQRPAPSTTNSTNNDSDFQDRFNEYMGNLLVASANSKQPTVFEGGYKLDDLLIKCTFNGRLCHRNLTSFFHPNYGNCYTFDNDKNVEVLRRDDSAPFWSIDDEHVEDGYKLYLELFLYQNESIPYLDDRAAFRIFIHRKCEIPILSQNSLFVAPTTFTKMIFSQRIISFSQQCRDKLTTDMTKIFSSSDVRYSQALCYKVCEFRFIERKCQCTDQLQIVFFQFFALNHSTRIDTNRSCTTKDECLMKRHRFNSKKLCPECLPECELVQYTVQSSYADYPNKRSIDKVKQNIEKHFKKIGYSSGQVNNSACSNNRKELLLDDIVAVEISASPYATEILSESPMYTWVDLISSIGGQTGLWIGVSLISFVEFAELIFLLCRHFIKVIYQAAFKE